MVHPVVLAEFIEFALAAISYGLRPVRAFLCDIVQRVFRLEEEQSLSFLSELDDLVEDEGESARDSGLRAELLAAESDEVAGLHWPWQGGFSLDEEASEPVQAGGEGRGACSPWRFRYCWVQCVGDDRPMLSMIQREAGRVPRPQDGAASADCDGSDVFQKEYAVTQDKLGRNMAFCEPVAIQALLMVQSAILIHNVTRDDVMAVVKSASERKMGDSGLDVVVFVRQMLEFMLQINDSQRDVVCGKVLREVLTLDQLVDRLVPGRRDGFDVVIGDGGDGGSAGTERTKELAEVHLSVARDRALVLDGVMSCLLRFVRRFIGAGHHGRLVALVAHPSLQMKPMWMQHVHQRLDTRRSWTHRLRFYLKLLDEFGVLVSHVANGCVAQYVIFAASSYNRVMQSVFFEYCRVNAGANMNCEYVPESARKDVRLDSATFIGRQFLFAGFISDFLSRCAMVRGGLLVECFLRLVTITCHAVGQMEAEMDKKSDRGEWRCCSDTPALDIVPDKYRPVLALIQAVFRVLCFRRHELLPALVDYVEAVHAKAAVEGEEVGDVKRAAAAGAVPQLGQRKFSDLTAADISRVAGDVPFLQLVLNSLAPLRNCALDVVVEFVRVCERVGLVSLRQVLLEFRSSSRGKRDQALLSGGVEFGGDDAVGGGLERRSGRVIPGMVVSVGETGVKGAVAVGKLLDTFFPFRQYEGLSSSQRMILPLVVRYVSLEDDVMLEDLRRTQKVGEPSPSSGVSASPRAAYLSRSPVAMLSPSSRVPAAMLSPSSRTGGIVFSATSSAGGRDGSMSPRLQLIKSPEMSTYTKAARDLLVRARVEDGEEARMITQRAPASPLRGPAASASGPPSQTLRDMADYDDLLRAPVDTSMYDGGRESTSAGANGMVLLRGGASRSGPQPASPAGRHSSGDECSMGGRVIMGGDSSWGGYEQSPPRQADRRRGRTEAQMPRSKQIVVNSMDKLFG